MTLPNGAKVKPGPNFRFIGTMNGVPGDLSEALCSRFQVKISISEPHESALKLLTEDIRQSAKALILHGDPVKRVNFRQLLTFTEFRGSLGDDVCAAMVFGMESYQDVLLALKMGG